MLPPKQTSTQRGGGRNLGYVSNRSENKMKVALKNQKNKMPAFVQKSAYLNKGMKKKNASSTVEFEKMSDRISKNKRAQF